MMFFLAFPGAASRSFWLVQGKRIGDGSSICAGAPDAAQRSLRCAADPGPMDRKVWVPALRCIVKNAAPRPGHETAYADAVVTPPSTTMVCPVMKLDASEPR